MAQIDVVCKLDRTRVNLENRFPARKIGAIDDKRGTSALAKLTAQIFIAGVLVLMGVQLFYFWLPGGGGTVRGGTVGPWTSERSDRGVTNVRGDGPGTVAVSPPARMRRKAHFERPARRPLSVTVIVKTFSVNRPPWSVERSRTL